MTASVTKRLGPLLAMLLILLIGWPIVQPLTSNQLTCGFDNNFHLWRAVQLGAMMDEGVWFARWAPHMARGYGYPLYQFQSPLSAYGVAWLNGAGLAWPVALNFVYALGLLGSGITTYWLGRDLWGERGGIVAAIALLFTPYHLYVLFYRGSLSETAAWIFPPLVLWGMRRWQLYQQRRGLLTAVFSYALLIYTHDVTAYLFTPLFLAWAIALCWIEADWSTWRRGLFAWATGLAAGAFFWVPAVLNRRFIQFDRAGSAWPFLPQNNFLPLDELLPFPRLADPLLLNDWPPRGLSAILLLLAVVGIVIGWRSGGRVRRQTAVWALFLAGHLFLVTGLSAPLWNIPLLAVFQFPWRFLAPVTLITAVLVGSLVTKPESIPAAASRWPAVGLTIGLLLLLSTSHWGWRHPALCDAPADLSIPGLVAWERETDTLGSTASRELLPTSVERLPNEPDAPPPWEARLLPDTLPSGAQLISTDVGLVESTITLTSPVPFTLRYRAFAFPGWRATVNGRSVPITPATETGLITLPVPAGTSTIVLRLGNNGAQWTGWVLTSVALLAVLFMSIKSRGAGPGNGRSAQPISLTGWGMLAVVAVALLLLAVWIAPARQTRLTTAGELTGLERPSTVVWGDPAQPAQIRLLGYEPLPAAVRANEPLVVTLYWRALTPLSRNYRVGLILTDNDGNRWSADGLRDYRWRRAAPPTTQWPTDQYVRTDFFVDSLPGLPPGTYALELTLFDEATFQPLTAYDPVNPLGPSLPLTAVQLTPPRPRWTENEIDPQISLTAQTAAMRLVGATIDRGAAAPGDAVGVTLFWSAPTTQVAGELLLLLDGEAAVVAWPETLRGGQGGVWRHQTMVRLPVSLDAGVYLWGWRFPDGETAVWGNLTVETPTRQFDPPPLDITVDQALGERATLLGAQLNQTEVTGGDALAVTLVWRAEQEMTTSYRIFVQLLDENGRLISQSDGLPVNWSRPTTGWLPGEILLDPHTLPLPTDLTPQTGTLIAGLYTVENGRLTTASGVDNILVTAISIR